MSVACDPVKVPLCADERADSFLVPDECVARCIEPRVSLGRGQSCRSPKKRMVERSGLSRAAKHLFPGQARSLGQGAVVEGRKICNRTKPGASTALPVCRPEERRVGNEVISTC